jgi:hypothetical protein
MDFLAVTAILELGMILNLQYFYLMHWKCKNDHVITKRFYLDLSGFYTNSIQIESE